MIIFEHSLAMLICRSDDETPINFFAEKIFSGCHSAQARALKFDCPTPKTVRSLNTGEPSTC